jgi:predicted acyltransferase
MKGRPVLGVISGLLFGLFVALTLQQFGIMPLTTLSLIGLPIIGIALGLGLAASAPFGKKA